MRHYKGHVQGDTAAADSDANWARFTFHESVPHIMDMGTTSPPPFEGVFAVNGEMYTVKLEDNYARSRRASDVPVALDKRSMPTNGTATTRVIIYRESDRAPANGTTAVADDMIGSCGADDLEYNGEPAKRAYEERLRKVMFDEWMQTGTNPLLSKRSAPGCPTATKILYMVGLCRVRSVLAFGE